MSKPPPANEHGAQPVRLDAAVTARYPHISRTEAQRLIAAGAVSIGGIPLRKPGAKLPANSDITIDANAAVAPPAPPPPMPPVIHQDQHLLILDKPPGLVVHQGAGHTGDTLTAALQQQFPRIAEVGQPGRPGIVHRIDKNTSGLLAVALSQDAYLQLVDDLKAGLIKRTYTALACGAPPAPGGIVDAPVGRHPRQRTRQSVTARGKIARTRYRTTQQFKYATLLEIRLETGRMHQIRVHFAAIGAPIAGDPAYGGDRGPFKALGRQFLHAAKLELPHPVTRQNLEFRSPLPTDLEAFLATLRE